MAKIITKVIGKESIQSAVRHTAIVGLSGRGKDMFGEGYITKKIGKSKIIDFHTMERFEGFFYSIKNNKIDLIHRGIRLTQKQYEPKAFNNKIILFCGRKLMDLKNKKLPKNVEIRTLSPYDLVNEELIEIISPTDSAKGILLMILYFNKRKKMNVFDFKDYVEQIIHKTLDFRVQEFFKGVHRMTLFVILREIITIINSGIFNDSFPKINIKELIEDKDTITTISCFLLKSHVERAISLSILFRNIIKYREENDLKTPLVFYVREIQTFFKPEYKKYYKLLIDNMRDVLEQGRDNLITLVANFQTFSQLPPDFYRQFGAGKIFAFGMPERDASKLLEFCPIPYIFLRKLLMCHKGQGMYIAGGQFRYLMEVVPTQHLKKEEGFKVLDYLIIKYGYNDYSNLDFDKIFDVFNYAQVPEVIDDNLIKENENDGDEDW